MVNSNKIVMSCRIGEDMKAALEREAHLVGYSPSSYVEAILSQRKLMKNAAEVNRLNSENEALQQENTKLQEQVNRQTQNDQLQDKRLVELQRKFPKKTKEEIVQLCIATCLKNEQDFGFMYTLKDFIKENPNFLKSKNQVL